MSLWRRHLVGLTLVVFVSCGGGSGADRAGTGGGGAGAGTGGMAGAAANGGGAGGADAGAACPTFTPCGGDLVGTWQVTQTCLSTRQDLSSACGGGDAWATGSYTFSGSITYNADLTYSENLTGSNKLHYHYPIACLQPRTCDDLEQTLSVSGATFSCTADATAGTCDCDGVVSTALGTSTGTYSVSGTTVLETSSVTGATNAGSYCVQGSVLHEIGSSVDGGAATLPVLLVFSRQ